MVWFSTTDGSSSRSRPGLKRQPPRFREYLMRYGYIDRRLQCYILCCDDARYLNHSDRPNLRPDYARERHGVDVAVRDIAAGEELTVDYRDFEEQGVRRRGAEGWPPEPV